MIAIQDTLISEDILEKEFVCDLSACKGQCCVQGESGAPLEDEEVDLLESLYPKIKPYLRKEGIEVIEETGTSTIDSDGDKVTPLVNNSEECAYVTFDEDGTAKCGIEQAWADKAIDFQKPVSCHLYPIRISNNVNFTAVNYHRWQVCKPACECGAKLEVKIFEFLKVPLIRKFGEKWYSELKFFYHEKYQKD